MVKVAMPTKLVMAACLAAVASAANVNFINKCSHPIELVHSQSGSSATKIADIAIGATFTTDVTGPAHMYRHTTSHSSTLLELSIDTCVWYDISIIPPLPGYCSSWEDCHACATGTCKSGFNVPMSVEPKNNIGSGTCSSLFCAADSETECSDAYLFPMDNTKTHQCPTGTEYDVTFCYNGSGGDSNQQQQQQQESPDQSTQQSTDAPSATTAAPTQSTASSAAQEERGNPDQQQQQQQQQQGTVQSYSDLGEVKATYSYKGKNAGNVPGSYDRVTDLGSCTKEPVTVNSPVGPMSEEVTLIFRGPCEIENIAVYSDEGGNGTWSRVSSYSRQDQTTENLVFMNNKNIDYSGQNQHGPQGLATADGLEVATEPTVFNGKLAEATDPSKIGGGPGVSTGAEINIMTAQKCNGDCQGFSGDNDYHGWGGGKKAFVTEVVFPKGSTPDQPAIWMLNAQVVHSNQYGCNCRGMGPVGGCGELDIAEVIETNPSRDMVTTHYYFYDGSILSPGGDNFAPRSYDSTTVYLTLIDDSNDGLIKIVELAKFDFTLTDLNSIYQQLVDC
ncbi:target of Sbf [Phytophthora boehmeriae]|uniref:glucan endo-1,3-beta-D-glucosidase n=1 Tax=Phytophthora boehmeriae TaxID=109152 RepID=A0A8T1VU39_9STRA|nr:target of Sbf [Phytophthora boehmeriae]